jgi:hypothetical protein
VPSLVADGRATRVKFEGMIGAHTATRTSIHLPEGEAHFDSFSSQVARGSFSEGIACSLCSLDQTAHFLIAAWNPRRPWQKQVGAHSRKCPLTTATQHAQAPGETTGMYESRSHPPCALGKSGSNMEANALHRSTRDEARVGIVSSFACTGSAGQRPLLTSPR